MKKISGRIDGGPKAYYLLPENNEDYLVILKPAIEAAVDRAMAEKEICLKLERVERTRLEGRQRRRARECAEKALECYSKLCRRFGSETIAAHVMTQKEYTKGISMLQQLIADPDAEDWLEAFREVELKDSTAMLLALHVTRALNQYWEISRYSDKERRRVEILKARYVQDPAKSCQEIAEQQNVVLRTVYAECTNGVNDIAVLLFSKGNIMARIG